MPEVFVKSFAHLKDKPRADQALQLLQRIASLVKPIMRKHAWVLPVLAEFFPDDPNLLGLNINSGEKILVRLRPSYAPDTFYDEENIVHTTLHELTHNVHGPHDEKFYKFLSGLEEEYEALRRSGYAGEGFHSVGRRIGTNVSHDLPPHLARRKAVEAAEKRRKVSVVMSGGGRLGGIARNTKSPREAAAEAAERRARDETTCASGAVAQKEAETAARDSVQDDVIDLTIDSDSESEPEVIIIDSDSSSPSPPHSSCASSSTASLDALARSSSSPALPGISRPPIYSPSAVSLPAPSDSARAPRPTVRRVPLGAGGSRPTLPKPRSVSRLPPRVPPKHSATLTPPPTRSTSIIVQRHGHDAGVIASLTAAGAPAIPLEAQWTCPRCTLINDALTLQCAACLGMRPGAPGRGSSRQALRELSPTPEGWTCEVCGERDMPSDFWTCRFCGSIKAGS